MASIPDDPESSNFQHEMELPGSKRPRVCKSQHDIFLSHSGQEKAFVEQLYHDLKRTNQRPFFDQDSDCLRKAEKFAPEILEAAGQCRVGVVVVSEGYLTSKWPMLELSKFVECGVKVFPLFFKLSPSDLKDNEVETKWKQSWRELVERGEVKAEVVEVWSKAVKELRSSNGLEYVKFAKSEYKYRGAVVEEICKIAPPVLEWSTDEIQGYERLCEATSSMFMEAKVSGTEDQRVHKYLGIYGTGGLGKTTLCKSMCSYTLGEFGGRVLHLELPSEEANDGNAGKERLGRLKHAVQRLARFDKSLSDFISTEEEGWKCLRNGLRSMPPVFLAIDNVGDFAASQREARRYLAIGLPSGSKVLVTARSREILGSVLGKTECCKPIPRLEWLEAAMLFLSYAAPSISSVSSLKPKEREILEKCLSECQFKDSGYPSKQYHPLVLRALGTYFQDAGGDDVMCWEEGLEMKMKLQRCGEAENVNAILGLNYRCLSEHLKLVFLDSVLYFPRYYRWVPWWWSEDKPNRFEEWVSWVSEVHGVRPFEAKMMLKKLQRLSLLEGSDSGVRIHDLYKEFARVLVEREGSIEWQWWMCRSSDPTQLKRLVLVVDRSLIGCAPRRFLEWRSLVALDLYACDDVGPDLELGSFHSLRDLEVSDCPKVKRIVCSCDKSYDDGVCCHKRNPARGCMSVLLYVTLEQLKSLEGVPFVRHCWNLQRFVLSQVDYNTAIYPASRVDSEFDEDIDFRYLQALRTFRYVVVEPMFEYDCDAFVRWLLSALQLPNLTAFEFRSWPVKYEEMEGVRGYTIDLKEVVGLSPRLSVLSVRLPWQIEEVKGLHLLPELTLLNLNFSRGLRRLPDLRCLPKLKWLCVVGCCQLDGAPSVGPGVQGITAGFHSADHNGFAYFCDECLDPYCGDEDSEDYGLSCPPCRKRMNEPLDSEDDTEGRELAEGLEDREGDDSCD